MNIEVKNSGKYQVVRIDSENIAPCMQVYRDRQLDGISISPHLGYKKRDLNFLKDYPDIKGIILGYADEIDLTHISCAKELEFITVTGNKQPMDYGQFPKLKELRLEWHKKINLPKVATQLKLLDLSAYKPSDKSLKSLPAAPNLERLELVQGNTISLDGIEKYSRLLSAEFHYVRNLNDINAITAVRGLTSLKFHNCKNITDYSVLCKLQELELLYIHNAGTIPSIKFVTQMKSLKTFRFIETAINDGDLTPLLRLKNIAFQNKKYYSHTQQEIRTHIGQSIDEP
ncbi:MAG TPA: hypothetical protein PLY93_07565 [Turneriella sp.]|nr:hypothetical protein [Turneriella sp.]